MFNFMNISFIYLLLLALIYILFDFIGVLYLSLTTFTLIFIRVVSPNSFSSRPATAWGQSDVSKSLQDRFNEVLTNNIVLTTLKDTFHSLLNTSTSGKTKSSMNNSFSEFGRLSLSSTRSPQQPNRTRIAPSRRPSFSGRLLSPSPTVYRASPGSVTNAAGPLLSARFLPTVKRALGLDTVSNSPIAKQEERRPLYPQHSHAGFMPAVKLGRREKTRLDNSFSSVRSPNTVRIAPPDPHKLSSPRLFKVKPTNSNESRRAPDTQAVVTALKEKSRKRALDGTELTFQEIPNQLAKRRRQESQQSNASTSSLPPLPDSLPDLSTSGYSVPRVKTPVMKQHEDTPPLKHPANNGENTPSLKRTANMTDLTEADQEEHVNKRAKTDPSVHNSLVSSRQFSQLVKEDKTENKRLSDAKATLSALVNSSSTAPASSSLSNTISTANASSTSSVPSSLIGQSVTTPTIGQTAPASTDNKKSPVSEGAKVSAPSGIGFNFAKPVTSPVSSPTASVTQTTSASAPTGVLAALAGMTSSASSSVAGSAPSTTSSSGISSVGGFTFGAKNPASSPPTAPSNPGPNSTGTGTSTSATFTFSAASPPKSTVTSGFSLGSSALASTAASNLSVVSGFATTQPQLSLATSTSSSTSAPTGFTLPSAFAAPSAGGFTFGQALSAASGTEPPKTTSASTVSPAAPTFNFGAAASSTSGSSNPASTSSNFAFGQVSKPVTAPASAGFNFGGSSNTPTTSAAFTSTSSAVFGFGASNTPPSNTTATGNTSSAFTFSGTTTSTASGSTPSSNNFNFGGTSAPSFGALTTTKIGGFSFNPGATTTTSSSMAPAASLRQGATVPVVPDKGSILSSNTVSGISSLKRKKYTTGIEIDKEMSRIRREGANDVCLGVIGPYRILDTSLYQLLLEKWLSDEVIDAYLYLLIDAKKDRRIFHMVASTTTAIFGEDTNRWRGYYKRVNFLNYEMIIGACNERKCHWTLIVIYTEKKEILYLDPNGHERMDEIEKRWRNFVEHRVNTGKKDLLGNWNVKTLPHPRQKDSTSCGVFTLKFAESLIFAKQLHFEAKDMNNIRRGIGTKLLEHVECADCKEKSDIVFVTDDSISVAVANFEKAKSFIKRVLLPANIDSGDVRVGLLKFSTNASVEFDLNTYTSKQQLFRHVDSMQQTFGATYTAEALRVMNEEMLSESKGARDNVQNVAIIVVTDRRSRDATKTLERAKQSHQNGVHIIAIGVGDVIEDEISGIASLPSIENAFILEGFAQLRRFKEDFFKFCKVVDPRTSCYEETIHITMIVCTVYNVWEIQCQDIAWRTSDDRIVRMDDDTSIQMNCSVLDKMTLTTSMITHGESNWRAIYSPIKEDQNENQASGTLNRSMSESVCIVCLLHVLRRLSLTYMT